MWLLIAPPLSPLLSWGVWLTVLKPWRRLPCPPAHRNDGECGGTTTLHKITAITYLTPAEKAHHREEEPIRVEVLKHPLHRLPVDAERDAGCPQVQATAYHVAWLQEVLVDGGNGSGYATWWAKNRRKACGTLGDIHRPPWQEEGQRSGYTAFKWDFAFPVRGEQWEVVS